MIATASPPPREAEVDADERSAQAKAQALADARWHTAKPLLVGSAVLILFLIAAGIAAMVLADRNTQRSFRPLPR